MANIRKYYAKDLCEKHQLTLIKEMGRRLNVLDSDGLEHLILRDKLARGCSKINIKSAINKNEYFLTNLRKRFPDIDDVCDFSKFNYIKAQQYTTVTCRKHGDIQTKPNWLMNRGVNCVECCNENKRKPILTTEKYIENVKNKHGDRYDYSRAVFKGARELVTIGCHEHGWFDIVAYYHHNGNGCQKCGLISGGYGKSDYIKVCGGRSSNVYLFKINSDSELFYKIGISINPKTRINDIVCSSNCAYNVEILHSQEYTNAGDAWDVEKLLHSEFIDDSYKPLIRFDGDTECFKLNPIDVIKLIEMLG